MTRQNSSKINTAQTQDDDDDVEKLVRTKDFKTFLKMQEAIGEIPEDIQVLALEVEDQRKLVTDYHGWVNAGRPKPQLTPEAKGKMEKILSVSRVKHLGKQFLTYVVSGEDFPRGIKLIKSYAQVEQEDGSFIEDTGIVVKTEKRYTIKYTEPEAKKLMERCNKEAVSPKFYFRLRNRAIAIQTPENFTSDFDKLMAQAMKNEII